MFKQSAFNTYCVQLLTNNLLSKKVASVQSFAFHICVLAADAKKLEKTKSEPVAEPEIKPADQQKQSEADKKKQGLCLSCLNIRFKMHKT